MQLFQSVLSNNGWSNELTTNTASQLVLAFGDRKLIADAEVRQQIHAAFPSAQVVGCTTSGEIAGETIHDDSLCLTAIEFSAVEVHVSCTAIEDYDSAKELGRAGVKQLPQDGLKHVFVISDGQLVNGSELIEGITSALPKGIVVTGGLAGDGSDFNQTVVWHNDNIKPGLVVMLGFYGDALQVGHGHLGGWREFGPLREITKSEDNVLFELDNQPALDLYKEFLGEHAKDLPASALLFPLAIKKEGDSHTVVRTILNIDEQQKSMIFAGNMPEGSVCQLMRANYDNLVDGAQGAAENALTCVSDMQPQLAILISCVGRRLVLNQRVEEELEVVAESLPANCAMTGFYSYGEISPLVPLGPCSLHNQTMTITLLAEKAS